MNESKAACVCVCARWREREQPLLLLVFLSLSLFCHLKLALQTQTTRTERNMHNVSHLSVLISFAMPLCEMIFARALSCHLFYALYQTHLHTNTHRCDDALTSNKSITLTWLGRSYNKCIFLALEIINIVNVNKSNMFRCHIIGIKFRFFLSLACN